MATLITYGADDVKMSDVLNDTHATINGRSVEWRSRWHGYETRINGTLVFLECMRTGRWRVHLGTNESNLNYIGVECTDLDRAKEHALARVVKNG